MSFLNGIARLSQLLNKSQTLKLVHQKIRENNNKLFTKYLLITNITISTTFSGVGDFIEQIYEITAGYEDKWNKMRTLKMLSTGLPVGIVCHFWYITLDRFIIERTGRNLIKKFFLDQLIASPIYISLFFITLGIWNSWSKKEVIEHIKSEGKEIYLAEWYIWPLAQFINFYFLPTRYRILYDSTISLGFDVYFSYITNKDGRTHKIVKKSESI